MLFQISLSADSSRIVILDEIIQNLRRHLKSIWALIMSKLRCKPLSDVQISRSDLHFTANNLIGRFRGFSEPGRKFRTDTSS